MGEIIMSKLSDKLLEVELFVGEQLQDYTNEQVLKQVKIKYGLDMYVEHAKDLKKKLKKNGSNKNVIVTLIKSEGHTMRIKSNEIYLAEKIHKAFSTAGKSN